MGQGLDPSAITAIYDAALSADRWGSVLDRMVDNADANSALLFDFGDLDLIRYRLSSVSQFFRDNTNFIQSYNRLVLSDENSGYEAEGLAALYARPAFTVTEDRQMYDLSDGYDDRPEIRMCRELGGVYRRQFVKLSHAPDDHLGLIMFYGLDRNNVSARDAQMMEDLAPHLGKAIEVHRITEPLRQKYNAVLSVLDLIALPIVLFGPNGDVILKNRAASDMLSAREAIWLDRSGKLASRHDEETAALTDGVRRMALTARGEGKDQSVEVAMSRGDNDLPLYAVITPLRDAEMELETDLDGALMTLIDPRAEASVRIELVATVYRLSPAETRVAALVAEGRSNREIGDRLEVSAETVKSQLQSVFEKTGCRSRLAFLWRVFQFSPPIL